MPCCMSSFDIFFTWYHIANIHLYCCLWVKIFTLKAKLYCIMRLHLSFIIPFSVDGDFNHVQVFAAMNVIFDMYESPLIYMTFSTSCAKNFSWAFLGMEWLCHEIFEISQQFCKMASPPYSSTSYVWVPVHAYIDQYLVFWDHLIILSQWKVCLQDRLRVYGLNTILGWADLKLEWNVLCFSPLLTQPCF